MGIQGQYKLVMNAKTISNGFFPGPTTPNGTAYQSHTDCSAGCLFDLLNDETEHHDIAGEKPALLKSMKARLEAIGDTVYQSPGSSAADKNAVAAAHSVYGGFWGPWEGLAPTPSPTPPVAGKFLLVLADGKTCLRAESLARAGALGVGACD